MNAPARPRLTYSSWERDRSIEILDVTAGQVLRDAAAAVPDSVALVDGTLGAERRRTWTYSQFLEVAEGVAAVLGSRYRTGERLAVWAPNMPEWEMVQFGAAMAGLVIVAVNPAYTAAELQYVLAQSEAAGIVVAREHRGVDLVGVVDGIRDRLPHLREVLTTDPSSKLWQFPTTRGDLPHVGPDDPLMMQYTSGTTGKPKGVVLTHRSLCNNSRLFGRRLALPEQSVWLNCMPMFHIGGSSFGAIGSMWSRAAHIVTTFDPAGMLDLIEELKPAFVPLVPTMVLAMMEHPSFTGRDLSSVDVIMAGSTTVSPEIVRRVEAEYGCAFVPCFGQTEASGVIAQAHRSDSAEDKSGRAGQALEQVDLKVIDPVTAEIVPCGEVGQFCLRGYTTMREYFGMPEETSATLDSDGWLHTGDLGFMDDRGYVQVVGRLKDMIIRGGENIYPREIEDTLDKHPDISEVAVIGVPDDYWGEQVAAVVRLAPGVESAHAQEWADYARAHLAGAKIPRLWYVLDRMPTNPGGKIQKFRLLDLIKSGVAADATPERLSSRSKKGSES
ncbi:class I adenylate-forming enzyme family protein [Rhodococcus koreensis]|uniref:class I adenylate-forming enzyme family protein n=1 Tax=Rhodococcus koreensis TaxID=99653 RepID=UPI0036DB93B4